MNSSTIPAGSMAPATDDKTTAIVSYLTLIGFIVAIILHSSKKTRLGTFHLRQSLGLMLTSIAMIFVGMLLAFIPFIGWLTDLALWVGIMVLWVMGLLSAIKGEFKPLPLLGEHFQKWFGNAFE